MKTNKLNPNYVTGVIDGDGSVGVLITPKPTGCGWQIKPIFEIAGAMNIANMAMFEEINKFFGGIGRIVPGYANSPNKLSLSITGLQNCLIVQNHLVNYPLLTYKLVYFQLWSAIMDIMLTGAHLNLAGVLQIIAFKAHFKMGLSDLLINAFPNYVPIPKPAYLPDFSLLDIHWLAGFMNADGTFGAPIVQSKASKLGEKAHPLVSIGQNDRSKVVLEGIQEFLGFGNIHSLGKDASRFQFGSTANINTFIKIFAEAQLLGAKALDYADFCKIVDIINNKGHLTRDGLNTIRTLNAGMNSSRIFFGE